MRSSSRNIAILSSEANIASLRSNEDTQCATSRVLISRFCVMRMTLLLIYMFNVVHYNITQNVHKCSTVKLTSD